MKLKTERARNTRVEWEVKVRELSERRGRGEGGQYRKDK